ERLRPLDPGSVGARPEDGDSAPAQLVRESCNEGRLGADDDELDTELDGQRDEGGRVVAAHGVAVRERRDTGIARRRMKLDLVAAARESPDERMLATARPHDEHLHD